MKEARAFSSPWSPASAAASPSPPRSNGAAARRRRRRADRHALGERHPDDGDSARRLAADHRRGLGVRYRDDRPHRRPHAARVRGDARRRRGRSPFRSASPCSRCCHDRSRSGRRCRQARPKRRARVAASGARPWVRELADVAHPDQSDRGRGDRRDGAADSLHAASSPSPSPAVPPWRATRCSASSARSATRCWCWCDGWSAGADRRVRACAAAWRRTAAPGSPGPSASTSWPIPSRAFCHAAPLPGRRRGRAHSDARVRARGAARAAHRVHLELVDRVAAGAGRGAERGLHLPKDVTGFVLPLAVSTFKFAAPVSWTIGALFVAGSTASTCTPRSYATIAFAAIFLSFAAPGVPRGAFLMLTPLFLRSACRSKGSGS